MIESFQGDQWITILQRFVVITKGKYCVILRYEKRNVHEFFQNNLMDHTINNL